MADKSSYDEFIQIYNEIDHHMRSTLSAGKFDDHQSLIDKMSRRSGLFLRYGQELRTLARLRNSLVHNPFMGYAHPLASPNKKIVERYKDIRDAILNPPKARSIAVPHHKLYTASLDDNVIAILRKMKKKTYTHVPIIESDKMIGVFSENSLLAYMADQGDVILPKESTIKEFKDYIGFNDHPSEDYAFLPRNASLADVYTVFNEAIKIHRRIGVIFLTEHGTPKERPLGIITAWDLALPEMTI